MPLFTAVLDYRGGTYIRQVKDRSCKGSFRKGIGMFDVLSSIPKKLELKAEQDGLVEVKGTKGVWCTSMSIRGQLAIVHIVATAE